MLPWNISLPLPGEMFQTRPQWHVDKRRSQAPFLRKTHMDSNRNSAPTGGLRQAGNGLGLDLVASVLVPHAGAPVQYGQRGIVIVAMAMRERSHQPLLAIWDEGPDNPGTSATNAMQALLSWAAAFWPLYPINRALVLQRDSDGMFDEVSVRWTGDPSVPLAFNWRPVLARTREPRSWAAVQVLVGEERAGAVKAAVTRGLHR